MLPPIFYEDYEDFGELRGVPSASDGRNSADGSVQIRASEEEDVSVTARHHLRSTAPSILSAREKRDYVKQVAFNTEAQKELDEKYKQRKAAARRSTEPKPAWSTIPWKTNKLLNFEDIGSPNTIKSVTMRKIVNEKS